VQRDILGLEVDLKDLVLRRADGDVRAGLSAGGA
jgi:hypothetical protein